MAMKRWVVCLVMLLMGLAAQGAGAQVLGRDEAAKILPAGVFYRGQSATLQSRNAAGIRVPGGKLVLAALVDTSGYSTGVAERYQGYLITEVPLRVGDAKLAPGSYGFGFIAGNRAVVMDVGANELLNVGTKRDDEMKRPSPLQIVQEGGGYRLYLGRSFVLVTVEGEK